MIRASFDLGWHVRREGEGGTGSSVTLPHDAMMYETRDPSTPFDQTNGYHPGGTYLYSKRFVPPREWEGRSVALEFEGVFRNSEVRLNGRHVGGRPYGYSVFEVRLDDTLRWGEENLLEVVARNDRPSARWYTGSGIYRPVHLLVGGPVRIPATGLRLTTTSVESGIATVAVETDVVNDTGSDREVTVSAGLSDARGRTHESTVAHILPAGSTTTVTQSITVEEPRLWSPEDPALYSATATVRENGVELDVVADDFGIRTLSVDVRHGLRINGRTVKLRGGCVHHDNGVIGAHTLDAAEDRRIRILKESGYNAVRSSHYPASRAMLRACDRHGVLMMDELTDVWWRAKMGHDYSLDFLEWWERDLEAMVANDHNHPCVIMYSIGNEVGETATPRGVALNRQMARRARELDPSRPVTNGINGFFNLFASHDDEKVLARQAAAREADKPIGKNLILVLNLVMSVFEVVVKQLVRLPVVDKRTRDVFAELDVAGYNYMDTRYRRDSRRYPDRIIVGTETASVNTVAIWRTIETMPNVIGDFVWTSWDYIGEAGLALVEYGRRRRILKEYPVLLAGTPVIDITGHRQTQSYANQITWRQRTAPYLAVQPVDHAGERYQRNQWRTTNSLRSWTWPGHEGRTATVEVHSDAHRVVLLQDGVVVGSRVITARMEQLATFTVPYRPGQLTAIAYDRGGAETGRDRLTTAGPEVELRLRPETDAMSADGHDLTYLHVELTDAEGEVHVLGDRPVTLDVTGAGTLLGFGSAEPITEEGFGLSVHSTYRGRALAVVRAGLDEGEVRVTATAEGCHPLSVVIPVRGTGTRSRVVPGR